MNKLHNTKSTRTRVQNVMMASARHRPIRTEDWTVRKDIIITQYWYMWTEESELSLWKKIINAELSHHAYRLCNQTDLN